jgi:RNA polymerase sigma-70 factor (ECF subfamily)
MTEVQIAEHLINEEDAYTVHQFLHSMDEPYKEVFSLRTFGELPFEKIGRLFGKSAGWARITFYRARKQIIVYMEEMDRERD